MTDKELIKQEIERLDEEYRTLRVEGTTQQAKEADLVVHVLLQISNFIDSLPEESKKQPKFKVGDTIKGPCNNMFQVKEVLDKQYLLHSEHGDELNSIEIVDKYSCISEEPASDDLENAAEMFYDNCNLPKSSWWDDGVLHKMSESKETFIAGAEWQNNQMKEALQNEYEKGRFDMRDEMMKDAVYAWVNTYESVTNPYDNQVSFITNLSPSKFKNKETVKIIICKNE